MKHCNSLGIFASGLCLAKCISLPFIYSLNPWVAQSSLSEVIHLLLVAAIFVFSYFSFVPKLKTYKSLLIPLLAGSSLVIIVLAFIFGDFLGYKEAELVLNILGSLGLIIAHTLNIRLDS